MRAYCCSFKDLKGIVQACVVTAGLPQNLLASDHSAMDRILDAIRKIHTHSAELAKKAS